jgi:DNA-binding Lrp family transcriptional regulator
MKQPPSQQTLDPTDRQLIALLRDDARAPTAALARKLGLSRTTVQSRIDRLERSGVITGYSAKLAESRERGAVHAYILITVKPKQSTRVEAEIRKLGDVHLLQSVSGAFDMIAMAAAASIAAMDALIDAIGALDGVERTTSSIVLATKFER